MPTEEQLQIANVPTTLQELIRSNKLCQKWREPTFYNPNDPDEYAALVALLSTGEYKVVQELENWATDISEVLEPSEHRKPERAKIYDGIMAQGDKFGLWVADHHTRTVTQIAERDLFWRVRTARNFPQITLNEQSTLADLHIVVIGHSVGSTTAIACALTGMGGTVTYVDFDTISWSNYNRLLFGISDAGMNKVVATANRVASINPYVKQRHYYTGATDESLTEIFAFIRTLNPRKTIIIEAIDGIPWKYEIRRLAKQHGIPIVMPTDIGWGGGVGAVHSSGGAIQVERHDIEPDAEFFDGRLDAEDLAALASKEALSRRVKGGFALKIIGPIPRRMAVGMMEVDNSTTGFTQLGSTVLIQGAGGAMAVYRIALGYDLPSGWYSAHELSWLNDQL